MEAHFLTDSDLVSFLNWLEKRGDLYVTARDDQGNVGVKPYSETGDFAYPGQTIPAAQTFLLFRT